MVSGWEALEEWKEGRFGLGFWVLAWIGLVGGLVENARRFGLLVLLGAYRDGGVGEEVKRRKKEEGGGCW